MGKKLIIICGTMGVGKTTVCRKLYKELDNSAWLDGDWCWMMNPFNPNSENRAMSLDNISYLLNSFLHNSSVDYVLFSWVLPSNGIFEELFKRLDLENLDIYKFKLMVEPGELVERMKKDDRSEETILDSLGRIKSYKDISAKAINTTGRSIESVTEQIRRVIIA